MSDYHDRLNEISKAVSDVTRTLRNINEALYGEDAFPMFHRSGTFGGNSRTMLNSILRDLTLLNTDFQDHLVFVKRIEDYKEDK